MKSNFCCETYYPNPLLQQGVAGGRNRGAETAKGEICVFLDDDARFHDKDATNHVVKYFQDNQQLACIAFHIYNAYTGQEAMASIPRIDKKSIKEDYFCSYFSGGGCAILRQAFLELGMYWEPLFYSGEELDLSYRLIEKGYRIIHTNKIKIAHREAPDARPKGQWVYFNARNHCWVSLRNLQWINVITMTLSWWIKTCFISFKQGYIKFLFRGIWHCLKGIPTVNFSVMTSLYVIPTQGGIQITHWYNNAFLDYRFHGNDILKSYHEKIYSKKSVHGLAVAKIIFISFRFIKRYTVGKAKNSHKIRESGNKNMRRDKCSLIFDSAFLKMLCENVFWLDCLELSSDEKSLFINTCKSMVKVL